MLCIILPFCHCVVELGVRISWNNPGPYEKSLKLQEFVSVDIADKTIGGGGGGGGKGRWEAIAGSGRAFSRSRLSKPNLCYFNTPELSHINMFWPGPDFCHNLNRSM